MKILIFNWKDIKNPEAGGAEVFTHEIAKRLVKKGHDITLFTSYFPGAKKKEEKDGIEIIRKGKIIGFFDSVYSNAKKFYKENKKEFDLIIDEINTRPFLTPKYVDKPIIALIHQLAKEFWNYKTPFPISFIGRYFLEPYWLKHYKNVKTVTVSNSTKMDLINLGFRDVEIVYNGLDGNVVNQVPIKEKEFTCLFVGRLTKTKKPEDAIKAFRLFGEGKLIIVGQGKLFEKLKRKYNCKDIEFKGFLSQKEKIKLMKKSHVLLVPGIREGFGRVVIEANACGTPAIGYNIPGLKDSIKHNYNGLLCDPNPEAMSKEIMKLYENVVLRKKLSKNAIKWAKEFSWDKSAEKFERIIKEVVNKKEV